MFSFSFKKKWRNEITSRPVHGSQSWKVPLLMSLLTLVFCLGLTLLPETVRDRMEASLAQPRTLGSSVKMKKGGQVKSFHLSCFSFYKHGYKTLSLAGLSRACCLLYMSSLADKMALQIQMLSKKPQIGRSCLKKAGCPVNVLSQQTHLQEGIRL